MDKEDPETMNKDQKTEKFKKNREEVLKKYPNARDWWQIPESWFYFMILGVTLLGFAILLYIKICEMIKRRAALKFE